MKVSPSILNITYKINLKLRQLGILLCLQLVTFAGPCICTIILYSIVTVITKFLMLFQFSFVFKFVNKSHTLTEIYEESISLLSTDMNVCPPHSS